MKSPSVSFALRRTASTASDGAGDVLAQDVLDLDRLGGRRDRRGVQLGELRVLVEDVVELALEPIELLVGQSKAGEIRDVLDVRAGESSHRRMILDAHAHAPPDAPRRRRCRDRDDPEPTTGASGASGSRLPRQQPDCVPMVAEVDGRDRRDGHRHGERPRRLDRHDLPRRRRGAARASAGRSRRRSSTGSSRRVSGRSSSSPRRTGAACTRGWASRCRPATGSSRRRGSPHHAAARRACGPAASSRTTSRRWWPSIARAPARIAPTSSGASRRPSPRGCCHSAPTAASTGFVIRAPWGGGATVARSIDAARCDIDARAGVNGRTRRPRARRAAPGERRGPRSTDRARLQRPVGCAAHDPRRPDGAGTRSGSGASSTTRSADRRDALPRRLPPDGRERPSRLGEVHAIVAGEHPEHQLEALRRRAPGGAPRAPDRPSLEPRQSATFPARSAAYWPRSVLRVAPRPRGGCRPTGPGRSR